MKRSEDVDLTRASTGNSRCGEPDDDELGRTDGADWETVVIFPELEHGESREGQKRKGMHTMRDVRGALKDEKKCQVR